MTSLEQNSGNLEPQNRGPETKMPVPGVEPKYIDKMPPPTDDEIVEAAKYGFDLTKWERYYTPESWKHRND